MCGPLALDGTVQQHALEPRREIVGAGGPDLVTHRVLVVVGLESERLEAVARGAATVDADHRVVGAVLDEKRERGRGGARGLVGEDLGRESGAERGEAGEAGRLPERLAVGHAAALTEPEQHDAVRVGGVRVEREVDEGANEADRALDRGGVGGAAG